MADEIDLANDLIDNEVARALSKRRLNIETVGSLQCIECGEDMPTERQKMGFKLCVPCALETERRRSLFAE